MSELPVITAFGSTDVIEMWPMPSRGDVHKYSSVETVEHVLGPKTNAILIHVPLGSELNVCEGSAVDVDVDDCLPLPGGFWPYAVTPGSTITCIGSGTTFDFRIQEAQL